MLKNKGFEANYWWRCKSPIIVTLSSQIRFQTEIKFSSHWMKRPPQKQEIVIIPFLQCIWLNFWIFSPLDLPYYLYPRKKVFVAFLPSAPINMLHMIIPFAQTVVGHYLVCWAHSSCILMILDHPCYLWDLSHCRKNNPDFPVFQKIWYERSPYNFC